jgi:hypothetical protein
LRAARKRSIFGQKEPLEMLSDLIEEAKRKLRNIISPKPQEDDDPDAPFAMVGAPLKPRPPLNRSSISVRPEA